METNQIESEIELSHVGRKSVYGIVALISRQFVLQIISVIAFLIISARLSVSEIGIYTAVIAIQRVISFFTDFGLGAALVQKKEELTHNDLTTSFTIQSAVTLSIFLLVFAAQGVLFPFFRLDANGGALLLVLVFSIFLSSFKVIPSILLERKIQFEKLIIPQIGESLAFNIVLIVLVLQGFGIASYTWAFLISSLVGIPIYYLISPWRIGLGIDRESLHHLKFGAQFQIKNILATIKDDMLTVILTKFLSFGEIGYIGFAQRISFLTYRFVVDSVTKVTFSTYARLQHDVSVLKKAIEKSLFFVSASMFPILVGLIITMPYFIEYYGKWHHKWEPAIVSITFFSLNAMVSALSGILVNVLDATGKVKWTLYLMVFWTMLTWILTPLLIWIFGYNGVAAASFLVTLTIGVTIYLVKQYISFNFWASIIKPIIATVVMGSIVFIITRLFVTNFLTLGLCIMSGGVVYIACFYIVARDELFEGISIIRKRYGKE
jgi:O-antigen/teichoic acid export membrane protein